MKKKLNIKEYFDGENTIDLSLSDLDEVPVKEIATIPKATVVELANNRIATIGRNFSVSLAHLVKLDLSQNQIKELPDNFGLLVHLKHLDLYHNQITTLPASFSGLRSLRWLDLKDNPLAAALSKAVGECEDNAACQFAAKAALKFTAEIARVEDIKKKEEEQKQKKEAEERLELAQKKDKKKKKKKKNVKATEKVVEKPSNGQILVETKVEQVSTKKPEIRKSSYITMGSFIKFVLITVLLSSLGLFTLRLLDEESYTKVTSSISKNVKYFKSRLPGNTRTYFDSAFKFLYKSFLSISSFVYKTTSNLGQFTVKSYTFLTTDETVQTYLRIFQDYIHIGYIKSVETISFVYKQLSDTVKSYLK